MARSRLELLTNAALLCVIAGILVALLLPARELGDSDGRLRTMSEVRSWFAHGLLFTVLGLVVGLQLAAPDPSRLTRGWVLAAVVAIVTFAAGSEFAQLAVEGRNATFGDWVADLVGMTLGLAAAATIGPPLIDRLVRPRNP